MTIQLSHAAFLSVTLSSIEAYKKECYGLLMGYRTDTSWIVEYAVPYQTADRGHKTVTPHSVRDRRVRNCLPQLCAYEPLGTFHSHPAWGNCRALAKPSIYDVQSLAPGDIEIIVAVNDAKPRAKINAARFRQTDRGRKLSGTVCDFALTLVAFYKPPMLEIGAAPRVRCIPLRCPYAIGFDPEINWK